MATEKSGELIEALLKKGYPEEFCKEIAYKYLNTDFTASRMIGYLNKMPKLKIEDCVDEMLAILSDRNRIMQKKELEEVNVRWNVFLNTGFDYD